MSLTTAQRDEQRAALKGLTNVIPEGNRYKYSIKDVKTGGYIKYNGKNYLIKSTSFYLETKWKFKEAKKDYYVTELELFSLKTGETLYMEWEFDDKLEIYATKDKVKLRDITSNGAKVGVKDIENIGKNGEGDVEYNGRTYYYSDNDSWAALYLKDKESEDGDKVRLYEFYSDDDGDDECFTIEMWYDDDNNAIDDEGDDEKPDPETYISIEVSPDEIEILQLEAGK